MLLQVPWHLDGPRGGMTNAGPAVSCWANPVVRGDRHVGIWMVAENHMGAFPVLCKTMSVIRGRAPW